MKGLTLKHRVVTLVLLVLIPAVGLLIHSYFFQARAARASAMERAISRAKMGATIQEFYLKQAEQLLSTLGQFPFLVLSTNYKYSHTHLVNLQKLYPDYSDFGLIEQDGSLFCDITGTETGDKEKHRNIFQEVAGSERFSCVLELRPGVEPTLVCGIPLFNEQMELARIVFASIKLHVLVEGLKKVPLSQEQEIFIFDQDGNQIAAGSGETPGLILRKLDSAFLQNFSAAGGGTWESESSAGIPHIFGASEVRHDNRRFYNVAIKIPRHIALANAQEGLRRNLLLLSITSLALLLLSTIWAQKFLVQPMTSLASVATRLKEGDLTARAPVAKGNSEIAHLSQAFNQMADALASRETELREAYEKIAETNTSLEKRVDERTSQLKIINEELEAFSYSISHDLRAPLRHIGGFAELLQKHESIQKEEKAKKHLDTIIASSQVMANLIDDLLSFSRMAREKMILASVDVHQMVLRIISESKATFPDRNLQFHIAPLPAIKADPSMLRQVWVNLISNAVKYTKDRNPALINISVTESPLEYIFSIQDNGAGFDMKYVGKLFGVFQRLHREDEFEGTGIGLANVRRIVHRHGGRSWAEGEPGKGATFYFSLPKTEINQPENVQGN